ncbi:hypothetical protein JTB14_023617 [Gonioctena quinquepunctata]|nr:hypothetical protein JTB14_023617 [Gonioctena quinquepunctata]
MATHRRTTKGLNLRETDGTCQCGTETEDTEHIIERCTLEVRTRARNQLRNALENNGMNYPPDTMDRVKLSKTMNADIKRWGEEMILDDPR